LIEFSCTNNGTKLSTNIDFSKFVASNRGGKSGGGWYYEKAKPGMKCSGALHLFGFVIDVSTNIVGATHLWITCCRIQDASYGIPLNVTGALHLF
jgi:hypothetical protein